MFESDPDGSHHFSQPPETLLVGDEVIAVVDDDETIRKPTWKNMAWR